MSRNWWYELFSVIYVVHKLLLIHSFTVVFFFLKQKLPSFIVPIQMSGHGRLRLALGHNMMFMSTYSISLRGEKIIIHGWSQIMKARRSWRIWQKVMFMLFHGSEANILFIDHNARWSHFQKVVDARGGAWALPWGLVTSPFVNSRQNSTVQGVPCTVEPV